MAGKEPEAFDPLSIYSAGYKQIYQPRTIRVPAIFEVAFENTGQGEVQNVLRPPSTQETNYYKQVIVQNKLRRFLGGVFIVTMGALGYALADMARPNKSSR